LRECYLALAICYHASSAHCSGTTLVHRANS
jgi:hypothetical protein